MGGERTGVCQKLLGGCSKLSVPSNFDAKPAAFGRGNLASESVSCGADIFGETLARRIRFWPASGEAMQEFVQDKPVLAAPVHLETSDVELFQSSRYELGRRCQRRDAFSSRPETPSRRSSSARTSSSVTSRAASMTRR